MFIIVPAIIIFLAFSYLHLNEDVSMVVEIFIYFFIVGVIFLSLYIYKSIQKNLKQQEINKVLLEIHNLQNKLKNTQDLKEIELIKLKINRLEEEIA